MALAIFTHESISFMKNSVIVLALAMVSCQGSFVQKTPITGVRIVNWEQSKSEVSFDIANQTDFDLHLESTWKLFIESQNADSSWTKVPFVPCLCGTPCKQPQAVPLSPGESTSISWGLISRKCISGTVPDIQNIEEKVASGKYRMTFTLHPSKDGKRLESDVLEVLFEVK